MPTRRLAPPSRLAAILAAIVCTPAASFAVAVADGDGEGYEHSLSRLGAWGRPVPLEVQAQVGLVPGQGLLIGHVRPGSPAADMGLKPGDVLVQLNGTPIASRLDLRTEVLSHHPGDPAIVTLARPGGGTDTLTGEFGTRVTKRPLRPLTDAWEQRVKDEQIQRLIDEAARQQALAAQLAELREELGIGDAETVRRMGDGAAGVDDLAVAARAALDAASAEAARTLTGPWTVAHRWEYTAADEMASVISDGPPSASGSVDAPTSESAAAPAWRLTITVPAAP
ncbi:MAG: PDZ domain-containing protein [Planctomycetes bacterium]|nr:PDZ domain-containing protein [Planctomycetota bacterium]